MLKCQNERVTDLPEIDVCYSKPVFVNENNFILNSGDARFIHRRRIRLNWNGNYWGEARKYPKPIFGYVEIIPDTLLRPGIIFNWVNFDWHPAKEPYSI